jgi:hypothetical protein
VGDVVTVSVVADLAGALPEDDGVVEVGAAAAAWAGVAVGAGLAAVTAVCTAVRAVGVAAAEPDVAVGPLATSDPACPGTLKLP